MTGQAEKGGVKVKKKVTRVKIPMTLTLGADMVAWLTEEGIRRHSSASQVVRDMVGVAMTPNRMHEVEQRRRPTSVPITIAHAARSATYSARV